MDFPEITLDEQPVVKAPSAPASKQSTTELAAIGILPVALARFGDWRPLAAALVEKYRGVVFDVTTTKGMAEATAARAEVREPRYNAQRVSKASKSELAKVSKAIGAEEQAVIDALAATEKEIDDQITAEETRKAAAKKEREEQEAIRIANHQAGIAKIRGYVQMAQGLPSVAIAKGIEVVTGLAFGAEWEEFAVPAASAQCEVLDTLRCMFETTKAAEDAATAAREESARLARVAAEQVAEQKRIDDARALIAKHEKEAADKLAAERAEFEREKAEHLASLAPPPAVRAEAEPIEPEPAATPAQPAPIEKPPVEPIAATPVATVAESLAQIDAFDLSPTTSAGDDLEALLRDCFEFTKYAAAPFFPDLPKHPSTTDEWWAGLRERIENLQPRVLAALDD